MRSSWHFITGEYPPQPGGVSDYCRSIADGLAGRSEEVHVWAPPSEPSGDGGLVRVHRLRSRFGPAALNELRAGLNRAPLPRRLLVHYVAGAFGFRGMNLPFSLWLFLRRSEPVWVMFHEYAYPIGRSLKPAHNLLGLVTALMGGLLAARADRILVSTPAWEDRIPRFVRRNKRIEWLPVPSNVPTRVDPAHVAAIRQRVSKGKPRVVIGHFGTYGPQISGLLREMLPALLARDPDRICLLMGRGSDRFAESLSHRSEASDGRLIATGSLPGADLAEHLLACDLLLQPYPDGVTSRRSSVMAGLALGKAMVTNDGTLTEPIWRESGAVVLAKEASASSIIAAMEETLASPAAWGPLGQRAASLYESRFTLERSLDALCRLAAAEV